jgi:hypothetical protein
LTNNPSTKKLPPTQGVAGVSIIKEQSASMQASVSQNIISANQHQITMSVIVQNTSKTPMLVKPNQFFAIASDGNTYLPQYATEASMQTISETNLQPGSSIRGNIKFFTPLKVTLRAVYYQPPNSTDTLGVRL